MRSGNDRQRSRCVGRLSEKENEDGDELFHRQPGAGGPRCTTHQRAARRRPRVPRR